MTIYFDSPLDDRERRRRLYAGDVFVYSPRPSTVALSGFARQLTEEAFSPLDPQQAQDSLSVPRFIEIAGPLKPRFIHHPRTQELLLALLADLGTDLAGTYFDVTRMRPRVTAILTPALPARSTLTATAGTRRRRVRSTGSCSYIRSKPKALSHFTRATGTSPFPILRTSTATTNGTR
jgi:hypothetical protein